MVDWPGAVAVVEQVLGQRLVDRDDRKPELPLALERFQPDDSGGRLLRSCDDIAELLAAGGVKNADHVGAVVHRQVRAVVDRRLDVAVVGVVVLSLDRERGDSVLLDQRCRHVVLRRERVRRAEDDVGAARLQRPSQVRRLGGDVQARRDAETGERLLASNRSRIARARASAGPPTRSAARLRQRVQGPDVVSPGCRHLRTILVCADRRPAPRNRRRVDDRRGRQPVGREAVEHVLQVVDRAQMEPQQVAVLPGDPVALPHLGGLPRDLGNPLELARRGPDPNDRRHRKAERRRVDLGAVAGDHARLARAAGRARRPRAPTCRCGGRAPPCRYGRRTGAPAAHAGWFRREVSLRRQKRHDSLVHVACCTLIPLIDPSSMAERLRPCRCVRIPGPPRRADAPRGVLRRQRGLPLPRAGVRRAPVRAGRAARRRLAQDRQRGAGLRTLAAALAAARRPGSRGSEGSCWHSAPSSR